MNRPPGVALVTGASSGIGLEFARLLAARGHDLVLVARSKGRLDDLAKNLGKAHGVAVKAAPMDLGLLGSAQVLWELTESQGLEIEMLINNAGIGLYGEHSVLGPAQVASMLYSIS